MPVASLIALASAGATGLKGASLIELAPSRQIVPDDAEHAVEHAGIANRVEMGPQHLRRQTGTIALIAADDIAAPSSLKAASSRVRARSCSPISIASRRLAPMPGIWADIPRHPNDDG
jgi:hypothetical protein